MGYCFNPAPGWPEPPEGWTPPEGWRPDPTWPPAPEGWEFWIPATTADAAPEAPNTLPAAEQSETRWGQQPIPQRGEPQPQHQAHQPRPGPPPPKKRTGLTVGVIAVPLILLLALGWGLVKLIGSIGDPAGIADPEPTITQPVETQPREDPEENGDVDEPGAVTDEGRPVDEPSAGEIGEDVIGPDAALVQVAPNEPVAALDIHSGSGTPMIVGLISITGVERDWLAEPGFYYCTETPDEGEYIRFDVEVTVFDTILGTHEFQVESFQFYDDAGSMTGTAAEYESIVCVEEANYFETEWQPGNSYKGSLIAPVDPQTTKIRYSPDIFDGYIDALYEWDLADF